MNKTTRLEHARQLFLSIASLMGAETKLSGALGGTGEVALLPAWSAEVTR